MAFSKNCPTCGKEFTGNISKLFCGDACRKYFSRHRTGHAGIVHGPSPAPPLPLAPADTSGQSRTPARTSLLDYAFKCAINATAKVATGHLLRANNTPQSTRNQLISSQRPLEVVAPMVEHSPTQVPPLAKPMLSAPFYSLLGELSFPFQLLLWGLPGSGKSTFALQLANELALWRWVLYVSGEEDVRSATLADKQRRALTRPFEHFSFIPRLPATRAEWSELLSNGPMINGISFAPRYSTVVYDSITMLNLHPFYVKNTASALQLPDFSAKLGHIFVSHAHKDGKEYRGDARWGHEVDIIIRCNEGTATIQKNRFSTADKGGIGSEYQIY